MTSVDRRTCDFQGGAAAAALLLLAALLAGCRAAPRQYEFTGAVMGTTYTIKVAGEVPRARVAEVESAAVSALRRIDDLCSTYKPESVLSQFNARTDTEWMPIPAELRQILLVALDAAFKTSGAFDPTVGPLVNAWGFGPGAHEGAEPTPAELQQLRQRVGWDKLELDAEKGLRKTQPDLCVDLSAVAKGYGVDMAAEALEKAGVLNYMVEVGGEVRVKGKNGEGVPWRIAIERPETETRTVQRVVSLNDRALATSGTYRNFREVNGHRFAHLIDPRTGRPTEGELVAVSVVHDQCAFADAFATGLFVLGPRVGYSFAVSYHMAVLFVLSDGQGGFIEKPTPLMAPLLEPAAPAITQ